MLNNLKKDMLHVRKLSLQAILPVISSSNNSGYDLFSSHYEIIPPRGKTFIATDLIITVPENTCGRIVPKRGSKFENDILIGGGVIDSHNKSPIVVVMFNHSDEEIVIRSSDCIAQLIVEVIVLPQVQEIYLSVESIDKQIEIMKFIKLLEKPVLKYHGLQHGPIRFPKP